jgi:hypothetical protein
MLLSQSGQACLDGQVSRRRRAAAELGLKRGTTPPPGSIPRRCIISQIEIDRDSHAAGAAILIAPHSFSPSQQDRQRAAFLLDLGQNLSQSDGDQIPVRNRVMMTMIATCIAP